MSGSSSAKGSGTGSGKRRFAILETAPKSEARGPMPNSRPACRMSDSDHVRRRLLQANYATLLKMLKHPHAGSHRDGALNGVTQSKCPQIILRNSLGISFANCSTVSWTSAICRRVSRRQEKVGRLQGDDSRIHRMCSRVTSMACTFAIARYPPLNKVPPGDSGSSNQNFIGR